MLNPKPGTGPVWASYLFAQNQYLFLGGMLEIGKAARTSSVLGVSLGWGEGGVDTHSSPNLMVRRGKPSRCFRPWHSLGCSQTPSTPCVTVGGI